MKKKARTCFWAVMLMILFGIDGWAEARAADDQVFVL